jgi:excisionase family DNA binding protein
MVEKVFRTHELAKLLGVSTNVIGQWIRDGKIKAFRIGKLWFIKESEVQRLMDDNISD